MLDKVVGIFSRESEETYKWLIDFVESLGYKARPVYVSASSPSIWTELRGCKYAVLYHSKNRGRVNITNVTDSLYDKELRDLSEVLGKKHVMVVIDDLDDSSEEAKERILENQPSIKKLAQTIFLISKEEKKHQSGEDSFAEKKRQMKKLWKDGKVDKLKKNQKSNKENSETDVIESRESPPSRGTDGKVDKLKKNQKSNKENSETDVTEFPKSPPSRGTDGKVDKLKKNQKSNKENSETDVIESRESPPSRGTETRKKKKKGFPKSLCCFKSEED